MYVSYKQSVPTVHVSLQTCNKSKYAKSLLDALRATSGIFPPINWASFDTRKLYWSLLYSGTKSAYCIEKEPHIDWDKIWPEILSRDLPSNERLISYKILHFALPFKCFLHSCLDKRCVACGKNESDNPKHFFSECVKYAELRQRMNTAVKGLDININWNWDIIRSNGVLGPKVCKREQKILRTICAVYKSTLWHERLSACQQTPQHYKPDNENIDNLVASTCQNIMSLAT